MEMIKENTLIINTDGAEVGVINGLTVLSIEITHLENQPKLLQILIWVKMV